MTTNQDTTNRYVVRLHSGGAIDVVDTHQPYRGSGGTTVRSFIQQRDEPRGAARERAEGCAAALNGGVTLAEWRAVSLRIPTQEVTP